MFRSAIVLLVLLLTPHGAPADPTHVRSASTCKTDSGYDLRLPPGYFVEEPDWRKLDDEVKRLQGSETQLRAENESLRELVASGGVGWQIIVGSLLVGAAAAMCVQECW